MTGRGPSRASLLLLAGTFSALLAWLGPGPSAVVAQKSPEVVAILLPGSAVDVNFTASQNADPTPSSRRWRVSKPRAQVLEEIREENDWKNGLILFWMSDSYRSAMPRIVSSWLRNWLACMALYFAVSSSWAYYIYWCFGLELFGAGNMPTYKDVADQMKVAMGAMPLYAVLPAVTEWVVENGYTRAYSRISDVGLFRYWLYFALYMTSVEFFVYWMHRGLHDVRIGYRALHWIHHKYNKEHSMSPFAGLAFHPLDGILQAIPYCWTLMYVPMHFLTHELLLFATGVWTTNIHDNLHGRVEPIMGAGYHTIHHTAYKYNYGHYTILMDKWFGTLLTPDDYPTWIKSQKPTLKAQ